MLDSLHHDFHQTPFASVNELRPICEEAEWREARRDWLDFRSLTRAQCIGVIFHLLVGLYDEDPRVLKARRDEIRRARAKAEGRDHPPAA